MKIYLLALLFSTIAGLSTLVGGSVAFFVKRNSMKMLSVGLGFSAGVMIFISLTQLLAEGSELIKEAFGKNQDWITLVAFACGILLAILIDYLIPDHIQEKVDFGDKSDDKLIIDSVEEEVREGIFKTPEQIMKIKRAGLTTAVALAIHNFPEGLTTFFATTADIKLGLSIVVAIALHNIPEGIAVAVPIYHATGSRLKAFKYCLFAGLAEPLGGVVGFSLIHFLFPNLTIGVMYATIAGIMTYISFDTLLPLSRKYDTAHYSITGVVLGMLLMGFGIYVLFP